MRWCNRVKCKSVREDEREEEGEREAGQKRKERGNDAAKYKCNDTCEGSEKEKVYLCT